MTKPLWKGRFTESMSEVMRRLSISLPTELRLFPYDVQVNRAWAQELCRIKILSKDELAAITDGLNVIEEGFDHEAFLAGPDEDVHSFTERRLTEFAGDAGAKIHTGRSRNDQVLTDLRLYCKDVIADLQHALREVVRPVVQQAEQHATTILPGYTHMQQAQPISLGHYLLSLATVLRDDAERLAQVVERCDTCPLGSGAVAGSAYPIDRERVAKVLGFRAPTPNSIATVSSRDECLELATACAMIMTHLSRYAEDWILWSGQEFHFVRFSDTVTTGSSMMPQKKNPDALELIRGKTARVIGHLQTLFTLLKGLPLTYARDLQEDKPALFDALDQTLLSLAAFAEVVRGATWNTERMRAALDASLYATELADYLTQRGLPFRKAHEIVGRIVADAQTQARPLTAFTETELQRYAPQFTPEVRHCFDPQRALTQRNLTGGTGPESVQQQVKALKAWLR